MWVLTLSQNQKRGDRLLMWNPVPPLLPPRSNPGEPDEPEEGECLFHSQMWVKGTPLHFIVDSGSQKNLISVEVIKWLALPTMLHPQPYTIGWLRQGSDLASTNNVACPMTSSPSKMRYCVMFLPLKFVMFFWANLIYGNVMLYMSLGLTVLLLLWTGNCTGYPR
jgi:hypothetical protein